MSKNTISCEEKLNTLRQEVEYYRQEVKLCRQEIKVLRRAFASLGKIVNAQVVDDDWFEPVGTE